MAVRARLFNLLAGGPVYLIWIKAGGGPAD
jgi:hypothetical protein